MANVRVIEHVDDRGRQIRPDKPGAITQSAFPAPKGQTKAAQSKALGLPAVWWPKP